jgi:hypothetical protein
MWFVNLLMAALFFFIGFYAMALCIASFIVNSTENEIIDKVRELKRNAMQGGNK